MSRTMHFLLLTIILAIFSITSLSQSRNDFELEYGQAKEGFYSPKPGIVLNVSFDNLGQASVIEVSLDSKNIFSNSLLKMIDRQVASEITQKLTNSRRQGKLLRKGIFSAGCTSIETFFYENVQINNTLLCSSKEKSEIVSIHIRWKKIETID